MACAERSSTSSLNPGTVVSAAPSKAAIDHMTSLAFDDGSEIHLNAIGPGAVRPDALASLLTAEIEKMLEHTPLQRLGESNDIARVVLVRCRLSQRIETRGNVARFGFADAHVRHRIPWHHALRVAYPAHQVRRRVAQHAGNVSAIAEARQGRPDVAVGVTDARHRMAGATAEGGDRLRAVLRISAGDDPDRAAGSHRERRQECGDRNEAGDRAQRGAFACAAPFNLKFQCAPGEFSF